MHLQKTMRMYQIWHIHGSTDSSSGITPVIIESSSLRNLWDSIWNATTGGDGYDIPVIQYSVDKIFAGKVPAFDINFIDPDMYTGYGAGTNSHIASQLSDIISKWYKELRNLAIVILLSVLVYTGIRIIISSSSDDRAKYKQRIVDWLVAMCLLFVMHYIMLFTVSFVNILNDTIGDMATSIPVQIVTGNTVDHSFNTSLTGLVRLQMQYSEFAPKLTFMIFYVCLVVQTVKFTWIYLKRLVTMVFLTIISPLVAMTYPIDKMNDGKAQAFDQWLKEYIFTALLQPFHLIVYTVLVGSGIDIVKVNPIFAIMVVTFIENAEQMLRKFFGFNKASSPSSLSKAASMFGGAAAMNMMKKGAGHLMGKGGAPGGKDSGGKMRTKTPQVEDPNAPSGFDGFTGGENTAENSPREESPQIEEEKTPQQQMLDAYDEGYGTDDWDPQERDAMAREAYANQESDTSNDTNVEQIASEPETPTPSETPAANNKRSIRQVAGAMAVAPFRAVGRTFKNGINNNFKNGNWKRTLTSGAKKGAKFAGRMAVAGTMGAIGVGMGMAGGSMEDVLTFGAAGASLGYGMAPNLGRRIANTELGRNFSSEMGRAIHGSDKNAMLAAQTSQLKDSGELRAWAQNTFFDENGNRPTGKALQELENRAIGHYNDGFTDTSELKKVMKLEDSINKQLTAAVPKGQLNDNKKAEIAEQSRVMSETVVNQAKNIKQDKLSNAEYKQEKLNEFAKGIASSNPNLSKEQVQANANQMMDLVMKYYKKS